jgi:hypothetical protein
MVEHGVQQGDHIQAFRIHVDGMDDALVIWVVVAQGGLVVSVAEPPIGCSLPLGPSIVAFLA